MTDLVRQALQPKAMNAQARKGAAPAVAAGFGKALESKASNDGAKAGQASDLAPSSLPAILRIRIGEGDGQPRLLDDPAGNELPRMAADGPGRSAEERDPGEEETPAGEMPQRAAEVLLSLLTIPPGQRGTETAPPRDEAAEQAIVPREPAPAASAALPEKAAAAIVAPPGLAREPGAVRPRLAAEPLAGGKTAAPDSRLAPADGRRPGEANAAGNSARTVLPTDEPEPSRQHAAPPADSRAGELPAAAKESSGQTGLALGLREVMPTAAARQTEQILPPGIRVLDAQSLPAPPPPTAPAMSISSAIAAAPDWLAARSASADGAAAASPATGPFRSLTIQLHPAELGSVTATMRLAGEQLSIELQVEKGEAYDKLAADRDAIVKAVRALGLEVDRITIQQSNPQPSPQARSENATLFNSGNGREAGAAPGGFGDRESGGAAGNRFRETEDDARPNRPAVGNGAPTEHERGLYI
jgi:chemotaxis protein MotD